MDLARLERRRQLLDIVDAQLALKERSTVVQGMNEFQQQALSILSAPGLKQALDIGSEPDWLRDAYGRTTYGQSCLLARRLIEAGTRFVTVYFSSGIGGKGSEGWDTHQDNFTDLKNRLLPITDQTVPTLTADLRSRGLLEETLVIWMGEFGRGPKIGDRDGKGRNHWPECYTVMMAGGGIAGGSVYGKSDSQGAFPAADPVRPEDIAATLYWAMGIDPATEVVDTQSRPLPISTGAPVQKIFA